jgi:hypothetical protein
LAHCVISRQRGNPVAFGSEADIELDLMSTRPRTACRAGRSFHAINHINAAMVKKAARASHRHTDEQQRVHQIREQRLFSSA